MSLLFSESPVIACSVVVGAVIGYIYKSNVVFYVSLVLLIILLYFYRWWPEDLSARDNEVLSGCEGCITNQVKLIIDGREYVYITVFLSVFNRHSQVYPVNGRVVMRYYDQTGKFDNVINQEKSRFNEKKIHVIQMKDGTPIVFTQIAGMLPRMIESADDLCDVAAGDYLGIIKFGSRCDLLMPMVSMSGKKLRLCKKKGDKVEIGELVAVYK